MPHTVAWDLQRGVIIFGGTVTPDELPALVVSLEDALGIGPGCEANWYETFMALVRIPDAKVTALKFWRDISGMGLKAAMEVINLARSGGAGPAPNAYPHLSHDKLVWGVEQLHHYQMKAISV